MRLSFLSFGNVLCNLVQSERCERSRGDIACTTKVIVNVGFSNVHNDLLKCVFVEVTREVIVNVAKGHSERFDEDENIFS